MINPTLRSALQNAAAEYDRLQSLKPNYRNNRALNGYLSAIDEIDELIDCGETLESAFNATFQSTGDLYKFLLPFFKKYAEPSKAKLPPKDFVAYLESKEAQ